MKKLTVFSSVLLSTLVSLPAFASVSCYVEGENPQIRGQYDQNIWNQTLSATGLEKHFLLLAADGKSAKEIPESQVQKGADISAILGATVLEIRRDETGYFSFWVSKVTAQAEDDFQLEMLTLATGSLVDGSYPNINLITHLAGNSQGVAMQCSVDRASTAD